jgi:hypothetical protein
LVAVEVERAPASLVAETSVSSAEAKMARRATKRTTRPMKLLKRRLAIVFGYVCLCPSCARREPDVRVYQNE